MTPKEFNRLPLSAKTGIVKDYGKLVHERKEDDTFTIRTYSVKTEVVETTRFIEVWSENKKIEGVAKIKMLRRGTFNLSN
jgi:hypothetical protein